MNISLLQIALYTVSVEFRIADQKRRQKPIWGTAIAISPNHLITAGHTVHWLTELRGPALPDRTSITFIPRQGYNSDSRIRAGQDFDDTIDRNDMLVYPSEDDIELEIYAFADGHIPTELYVVDSKEDFDMETDLMILYSAKELPHKTYPKPAKSRPTPYHSTQIGLIAYHGDETVSIYLDYPYTKTSDLDDALDKLIPDRLTLVKGVTGTRNDPNLVYHRCSSAAGSSGGALVNDKGELVGTTLLSSSL